MAAACEAMQTSAPMLQMLAQMPPQARAQCEKMHGQMLQMMQEMSGMMGGSGMMG